jgi:hypothetical protein
LVTGKNGIQITNWKSESVGFFDKSKTEKSVTLRKVAQKTGYLFVFEHLKRHGPGLAGIQGRGSYYSHPV